MDKRQQLETMSVKEYTDKMRIRRESSDGQISEIDRDLSQLMNQNEIEKIYEFCITQWFSNKFPYPNTWKNYDKDEFKIDNKSLKRRRFRCKSYDTFWNFSRDIDRELVGLFLEDHPEFKEIINLLSEYKELKERIINEKIENYESGDKKYNSILFRTYEGDLLKIGWRNEIRIDTNCMNLKIAFKGNDKISESFDSDYFWDDDYFNFCMTMLNDAKKEIQNIFDPLVIKYELIKNKLMSTKLGANYLAQMI